MLTASELAALWSDLAGDAASADRALWTLTSAPQQSVAFLQERLRPAAPADPQQVARLLVDLESATLTVRQKASQKLEDLGEAAEPALRQALQGNIALELRKRVEQVLTTLGSTVPRKLRAIETLEQIGTPEARDVLETLAKTAPNPHVRQAALAAVQRLIPRTAAPQTGADLYR